MTNFKREAKRIQDQKIKAEKDLKIYQEFLQFGKPK